MVLGQGGEWPRPIPTQNVGLRSSRALARSLPGIVVDSHSGKGAIWGALMGLLIAGCCGATYGLHIFGGWRILPALPAEAERIISPSRYRPVVQTKDGGVYAYSYAGWQELENEADLPGPTFVKRSDCHMRDPAFWLTLAHPDEVKDCEAIVEPLPEAAVYSYVAIDGNGRVLYTSSISYPGERFLFVAACIVAALAGGIIGHAIDREGGLLPH